MEDINIYKLDDNIKVYYTNKKVSLPQEYTDEVERHWNTLLQSGKKFFRGDIFTITNIKKTDGQIVITVELTDYAHFLYTVHKGTYTKHDCRVIYTSVLIETSDKKFAIAEMNTGTFAPGKLQFVGGGIDSGDIVGNSIDLKHSISKEIREETGISVNDKEIVGKFSPYILKTGGKSNFLSAVFKLDLLISGSELLDNFERFNREQALQGMCPELKSLVLVDADKDSVMNFIDCDKREKDENLIPALKAAVGLIKPEDIFIQ